jgi:hypothetical protein
MTVKHSKQLARHLPRLKSPHWTSTHPAMMDAERMHKDLTLKSSSATGITFTNHLNTDLSPKSFNLLNGSGVTLGDYDADGRCDVFLVAMSGKNKLFRNLGNWKFEETTRRQA